MREVFGLKDAGSDAHWTRFDSVALENRASKEWREEATNDTVGLGVFGMDRECKHSTTKQAVAG